MNGFFKDDDVLLSSHSWQGAEDLAVAPLYIKNLRKVARCCESMRYDERLRAVNVCLMFA